MSQIVVRRLFETDNVYVFQNSDRRLIFASPYQRDFTLIGTIGQPFKGDPAIVAMAAGDVAYLCDAANRYFRERVDPSDVVRTISGANAVLSLQPAGHAGSGDDVRSAARGKAPLLTMFGGDVTTSRLRAERAVSRFTPFYPDVAALDGESGAARRRLRLGAVRGRGRSRPRALAFSDRKRGRAAGRPMARALSRCWATPKPGPTSVRPLARYLTGAEVRYLMAKEWARFPDYVLWRRSKLGLTMPPEAREALAAFMAAPG